MVSFVSAKLAEVLGARVGDALSVETLEGKRLVRTRAARWTGRGSAGVTAYMEMHALNRLLEEGDLITGANFTVDHARRAEFLRELKDIPRVSWVATVGRRSGTEIEITNGLRAGDDAIIYPGDRIHDGLRVKPLTISTG